MPMAAPRSMAPRIRGATKLSKVSPTTAKLDALDKGSRDTRAGPLTVGAVVDPQQLENQAAFRRHRDIIPTA